MTLKVRIKIDFRYILVLLVYNVEIIMLFKEAVSERIFNLCEQYNYSPNRLAEMSAIPPSTLRAMLSNKVDNPSAYNIYKICKTLKISVKDFYDCDLFNYKNLDD